MGFYIYFLLIFIFHDSSLSFIIVMKGNGYVVINIYFIIGLSFIFLIFYDERPRIKE